MITGTKTDDIFQVQGSEGYENDKKHN